MGRGHRPDTGPDRPRAPDEAGVPLESEIARNHRSVNRSFIVGRGHVPNLSIGRESGRPGRGDGREGGKTPDEHPK